MNVTGQPRFALNNLLVSRALQFGEEESGLVSERTRSKQPITDSHEQLDG